jgi:hypothetical protein
MSRANTVADFASNSLNIPKYKNLIINGNFDIWQRALSQTSLGYKSADRWRTATTGLTQPAPTVTRQDFAFGQGEVPNNPRYYSRVVFAGVVEANGAVTYGTNFEDIWVSSGATMTLSFWARATTNITIAADLFQSFGTGGSPSNNVNIIKYCALTPSWQKFTHTATLPSLSGKTLGTNNNSHLGAQFWLTAGNGFGPLALPTQSGTVDFAQVQLEEGNIATDFEIRNIADELELCQRYFEKSYSPNDVLGTITSIGAFHVVREHSSAAFANSRPNTQRFKVYKRITPSMTVYSPATGAINNVRAVIGLAAPADVNYSIGPGLTVAADGFTNWNYGLLTTLGDYLVYHWAADAEIY